MEVVSLIVAGFALLAAGGAGGMAYGVLRALEVSQDANKHLRDQIARLQGATVPAIRSAA